MADRRAALLTLVALSLYTFASDWSSWSTAVNLLQANPEFKPWVIPLFILIALFDFLVIVFYLVVWHDHLALRFLKKDRTAALVIIGGLVVVTFWDLLAAKRYLQPLGRGLKHLSAPNRAAQLLEAPQMPFLYQVVLGLCCLGLLIVVYQQSAETNAIDVLPISRWFCRVVKVTALGGAILTGLFLLQLFSAPAIYLATSTHWTQQFQAARLEQIIGEKVRAVVYNAGLFMVPWALYQEIRLKKLQDHVAGECQS